jgi:hypothetical protein
MKNLLFLPLLLLCLPGNAQHYVRTKHNFGVTASYSFFDATQFKPGLKNSVNGTALSFGLTHEWKNMLYPELFFTQHSGTMPYSNEGGIAAHYKTYAIGAGMTARFDLFSFDNKKKNGYCFGRVFNILLGVEDVQTLNKNLPFDPKNEFAGKIGMGMYSVWGGSAKAHEAWSIHWEAFYRYGITPFMSATNPVTNETEKFHHGSVGVNLRVIYHKTYKFSDM